MHANVVAPIVHRRGTSAGAVAPPGLIRSIRSTGVASVEGGQSAHRIAAAKLALAGVVAIEEVRTDGTLRPLTPADVLMSSSSCAWRVSLLRHA